MKLELRFVVSLFVATTLVAAACGGGGVEAPNEAIQTTEVDAEDSDAILEDLGTILIADSDPDAIIDTGTTLLQTDRITVVLEPGTPRSTAEGIAEALGGEIISELSYIDLYEISVPGRDEASVQAAIEQADAMPDVQSAYSDVAMTMFEEIWGTRTSPLDDPVYGGDAGDGYRAIGVDRAWQYIKGSGIEPWQVNVGITDTRLWTGGDEFDTSKITTLDPTKDESANKQEWKIPATWTADGWRVDAKIEEGDGSHGTAVATIIGADADDGGAVGVASILGDRLQLRYSNVLDENIQQVTRVQRDPTDLTQYTYRGRTWSDLGLERMLQQVKAGSTVINMSWGSKNPQGDEEQARARNAYHRFFTQMERDYPNVVFVAAAGNDGITPDGATYMPAGMPLSNVITVGNVNNDGTTNESSNLGGEGFEVTIAAPGNEAVRGVTEDGMVVDDTATIGSVTSRNGGTAEVKSGGGGTSMAAPQVTATIALMKSIDPSLTAEDIKKILKDTARPGVPANPEASEYLPTEIDKKMGAGLLAVDKAVLVVVNRVRAANSLEPITGGELVQLGVIDSVAITGDPDKFEIRAIVTGCRGDCTDVSVSVSGEHALAGSTTQHLDAPGNVSWDLTVMDDYPVTVLVRRSDNGAGSRILIDQVPIAGTWTGTLTLTELVVPDGQEMPDGTAIEPGTYEGDELESCVVGAAETAGAGLLEMFRNGIPITTVFTGDKAAPGSVTISILDNDNVTTPWVLDGASVVFEWVDDGSYIAFSGTPSGSTMSGSWGAIQANDIDMRGVFSLTKVED
jgi:subtilisin family serine protease